MVGPIFVLKSMMERKTKNRNLWRHMKDNAKLNSIKKSNQIFLQRGNFPERGGTL